MIIRLQDTLQTYLCIYHGHTVVCECSFDCLIQMKTAVDGYKLGDTALTCRARSRGRKSVSGGRSLFGTTPAHRQVRLEPQSVGEASGHLRTLINCYQSVPPLEYCCLLWVVELKGSTLQYSPDMSSAKPYIGCKIGLVSKAQNRYEGILYTIDKVNSTVVLAKGKWCRPHAWSPVSMKK